MEEPRVPEEQAGKEEGQKSPEKKEEKPLTQEQFDKLYGEMKTAKEQSAIEREGRLAAEAQLGQKKELEFPYLEEEGLPVDKDTEKRFRSIVKEEIGQKEFVMTFQANENKVFEKHADMVKPDGTYDYESPKVKKYVEIGRKHPKLRNMADGPTIAMRMMESELVDEKIATEKAKALEEGKIAENKRQTDTGRAFTGASTTEKPKDTKVKITDAEHRIAQRMRMTDEEYLNNKGRKAIEQPEGAKL